MDRGLVSLSADVMVLFPIITNGVCVTYCNSIGICRTEGPPISCCWLDHVALLDPVDAPVDGLFVAVLLGLDVGGVSCTKRRLAAAFGSMEATTDSNIVCPE